MTIPLLHLNVQGMTLLEAIIAGALAASLATGLFYPIIALSFFKSWREEMTAVVIAGDQLPPVTLLRPLKAGVPGLMEKLETLAAAMRSGDQLLLGVQAGTNEERVSAEVRTAFPERDIVVVLCAADVALNPKICKLIQMTPHARHACWILSDSEAFLDRAWLDAFRGEWQSSAADVLTAGYRFVNLATWPQRLDAAATLTTLWPGLAMVRHFKRVNFSLGACTGFRREEVEAVGGWQAFGDCLAEDNRLGAALAQAGRTIQLSAQVTTLDSDPLTWRDYWRHQRRVAVTYRVSSPGGFAGMIVTNGFLAPAVWMLLAAQAASSVSTISLLAVVALVQVARWAVVSVFGRVLRFRIPSLFPLMIVSSAVELACWVAAWFDRRVWWAGRFWQVSRDGRLTPLG